MGRSFAEWDLLDYSDTKSTVRVYVGNITPFSLPGFLSEMGQLRAAMDAITVGTIARERWVGDESILSTIPPSDPNAQREMAWRVFYENYAGFNHGEFTVPCPDTSLLDPRFSDYADPLNPAIMAFITALETIAVDKDDDTMPLIIGDIVLLGRRY